MYVYIHCLSNFLFPCWLDSTIIQIAKGLKVVNFLGIQIWRWGQGEVEVLGPCLLPGCKLRDTHPAMFQCGLSQVGRVDVVVGYFAGTWLGVRWITSPSWEIIWDKGLVGGWGLLEVEFEGKCVFPGKVVLPSFGWTLENQILHFLGEPYGALALQARFLSSFGVELRIIFSLWRILWCRMVIVNWCYMCLQDGELGADFTIHCLIPRHLNGSCLVVWLIEPWYVAGLERRRRMYVSHISVVVMALS